MTPAIDFDIVDATELTNEQLYHLAWRGGDLSCLMHSGQLRMRDQIHTWRMVDQTKDRNRTAGSMPRLFAVEGGKRFGKTTGLLWILHEFGHWYAAKHGRGAWMRFTSAFHKNIKEIVGVVVPEAFRTAPDDCKPQYFGARGILPAGLYYPEDGPMMGARIALAGLDMNPDALRGQANDIDVISESAFVEQLEYTIRNVIYHQYQGRPWARAVCETSAPRDRDTDWEMKILPDCKKRGAIFTATIEDNDRLSRDEKDEFISAAGGRGALDCEREYFNLIAGDPSKQIFPEFKAEAHVRDVPIPKHCMAMTIADPGQVDQFALLFGVLDFDSDLLIIQDSWSESNAGSMKVAAVIAAREFDLWGTWPHPRFKRLDLESTEETLGWHDLLQGDRCEGLAEKLYLMAQTPRERRPDYESFPGKWVTTDLPDRLTYWDPDHNEHRSNPYVRVSDVDKQLIRDIDDHYGLEFSATTKVELVTMVRNARNRMGEGRVVFLPNAGPVIDHVRAGRWPEGHRRSFDRHAIYGHFDCCATYTYMARRADVLAEKRPHPPADLRMYGSGQHRMPWQQKMPHELELERRLASAQGTPGRIRGWNK